jgi:5-(carboxyamino)imidazole ribonucleotide synthase
MSNANQPTVSTRVGVVGAGQLARMMGEAASEVDVVVNVLATSNEDSAIATTSDFVVGAPDDVAALRSFAQDVDVITFDHELVDLRVLEALEGEGIVLRPNSAALRFAVDKGFQRHAFRDANIPVPRFLVVTSSSDERLREFLDELETPPVVKASRGGYDGRGVAFPESASATLSFIDEMGKSGDVVVEERLQLQGEAAQLVARAVDRSLSFYPLVDTLQLDGMCVEVRYPSALSEATKEHARELSQRVADLVKGVGIMAIEYFVTERGLIVNEVALRPHNTGHWTIEGATTSQFAQHLRAVSGQALGDVTPLRNHAVMVNVVGANEPGSLDAARDVAGTFVHDYGKSWRPGRKLGHVTALGDEATDPHVRAWTSARAYGTVTEEA